MAPQLMRSLLGRLLFALALVCCAAVSAADLLPTHTVYDEPEPEHNADYLLDDEARAEMQHLEREYLELESLERELEDGALRLGSRQLLQEDGALQLKVDVGVWKPVQGCAFIHGDGVDGREEYLGEADTPQACADLVAESRPTANGATISARRDEFGYSCYAEFGMAGTDDSVGWRSCRFGGEAGAICVEAHRPDHPSCAGYEHLGYTCVGDYCASMQPSGDPHICAVVAAAGTVVDEAAGRCVLPRTLIGELFAQGEERLGLCFPVLLFSLAASVAVLACVARRANTRRSARDANLPLHEGRSGGKRGCPCSLSRSSRHKLGGESTAAPSATAAAVDRKRVLSPARTASAELCGAL